MDSVNNNKATIKVIGIMTGVPRVLPQKEYGVQKGILLCILGLWMLQEM